MKQNLKKLTEELETLDRALVSLNKAILENLQDSLGAVDSEAYRRKLEKQIYKFKVSSRRSELVLDKVLTYANG